VHPTISDYNRLNIKNARALVINPRGLTPPHYRGPLPSGPRTADSRRLPTMPSALVRRLRPRLRGPVLRPAVAMALAGLLLAGAAIASPTAPEPAAGPAPADAAVASAAAAPVPDAAAPATEAAALQAAVEAGLAAIAALEAQA